MRWGRAGQGRPEVILGLGSVEGHRVFREFSPSFRDQSHPWVLSPCCSQGGSITAPSPGADGAAGGVIHHSKLQEGRCQNLMVPCFGEVALGSKGHVGNLGSGVLVESKMKL